MRVYQPMSAYRPVVVDIEAANFEDIALTVECDRGDMLGRGEARVLCARVTKLFENQGARVRTVDQTEVADDLADPEAPVQAAEVPRSDLFLEVRARKLHAANHPWSWLTSFATFTLLPGLSEVTFAHDVTVRDGDGFVLATDSIQGRLLTRFGGGTWFATRLADMTIREREERQIGSVVRELSSHTYGRLSQVLFNAKMQWEVQKLAAPPAPDAP